MVEDTQILDCKLHIFGLFFPSVGILSQISSHFQAIFLVKRTLGCFSSQKLVENDLIFCARKFGPVMMNNDRKLPDHVKRRKSGFLPSTNENPMWCVKERMCVCVCVCVSPTPWSLHNYRARWLIIRKVLKIRIWGVPPAGGPLL